MNKSYLVVAAISGLMMAGCATGETTAGTTASKVSGECHGVNSCKGKGECGGKGHSCAGKNSCKGKGWSKMNKADCKAKGGKFKG